MDITIHIAGGSSIDAKPSASPDQSPALIPLDAGASLALSAGVDSNDEPGSMTYDRAQAFDAGGPTAALLQEVEEALKANNNATGQAAASTDEGVSAGAAPA